MGRMPARTTGAARRGLPPRQRKKPRKPSAIKRFNVLKNKIQKRKKSKRMISIYANRKKQPFDSVRGDKTTGEVSLDKKPFARGASRNAYNARVTSGCVEGFTQGMYCVVKRFKSRHYERNRSLTEKDVEMQHICKDFADLFNDTFNFDVTLYMRVAKLTKIRGINFLMEQMIMGDFEKFNSNSGWSSLRHEILDAFSHWTWHYSQEKYLVCDLQGVTGLDNRAKCLGVKNYYMLTDPCINSADREFGMNDMGHNGIAAFFRNHKCNTFCRYMKIHSHRLSNQVISAAPQFTRKRSTSYTDEDASIGSGILSVDMPLPDRPAVREYRRVTVVPALQTIYED
eukprot:m.32179 g.32179  ORF g.32179 m.32179 type:complete len:341 (+) comp8381_c0_seq1:188-1210(+)